MSSMRLGYFKAAAGCLCAAASLDAAAQAAVGERAIEIPAAPAFDDAALTAAPMNGWFTNGGNLYNQRYSPLDQINRDNVADLRGVWRASPVLNGNLREGDNLFSVSIVAIDAATGDYRWHFQQVHHDIWDYDSPNPIILFDTEYDGRMRKGLAQAAKTGWVYILDRETGEPLIGIEEREVMQEPLQKTSPTQPFPIGDAFVPQFIDMPLEGYKLVNDGRIFTPFKDAEPVLWKPLAAANWPPSSYDPETNIMYICATDSFWGATGGDPDYPVEPGALYSGSVVARINAPRRGIFARWTSRRIG